MKEFTDQELTELAVKYGFGCWVNEEETEVIWFDTNPLPMMRVVLALAKGESI